MYAESCDQFEVNWLIELTLSYSSPIGKQSVSGQSFSHQVIILSEPKILRLVSLSKDIFASDDPEFSPHFPGSPVQEVSQAPGAGRQGDPPSHSPV